MVCYGLLSASIERDQQHWSCKSDLSGSSCLLVYGLYPKMAAEAMNLSVGVALVILGLCIGTGGMQFIRKGELRMKDNHVVESRVLHVLGMIMSMALGPLFDACGYAFAPAAVIAPFTGVNIVLNAMVAPLTLGETLTQRRFLCTGLVSFAAAVSVVFKDSDKEPWTLPHAEQIFFQWRVVIYLCAFAVLFLVNAQMGRLSPEGSVLRGFSLGIAAGSLAGNMWCTRVAAVFLAECAGGQTCAPWATSWIPYAMTIGAAFFAAANAPLMAKGLREYETIFMVTVFQGSNILSNSLSALVVLEEMDGAPWWKLVGYLGCVLGMMFGLALLLHGEMHTCPSDDLDEDLRRIMSLEEGMNGSSEQPNMQPAVSSSNP